MSNINGEERGWREEIEGIENGGGEREREREFLSGAVGNLTCFTIKLIEGHSMHPHITRVT